MDLNQKKIFITGGANGIGRALVETLLSKGARVGALDKDEGALESLRQLGFPEHLSLYRGDVSDEKSVSESLKSFSGQTGGLHGLVNNAAVLEDGLLISLFQGQLKALSTESWHRTLKTNLDGVFFATRSAALEMVQQKTKGVIVNISSISSSGNRGQTAYAASKAAINALTVTWAQELAFFGIRVAGVAPGMTDTSMPKNSMGESLLNEWVKKTPLKRMAAPQEIASAVLFAFENDYVNGRTLEIDGGLRM